MQPLLRVSRAVTHAADSSCVVGTAERTSVGHRKAPPAGPAASARDGDFQAADPGIHQRRVEEEEDPHVPVAASDRSDSRGSPREGRRHRLPSVAYTVDAAAAADVAAAVAAAVAEGGQFPTLPPC